MVKKPVMDDGGLELETRAGLPDALRVLLEDYPREAWEADPNFSDLIRFWLDRHLMFRRLTAVMADEAEKSLDKAMDAPVFAAHLSRYASMFANELHGHHMIEDRHYFPHLKVLDGRLSHGFDVLDRDHHAIDGHLARFAGDANAALRAISSGAGQRDAVAGFRSGLIRLDGFLNRHLTDEEDLIVPVLLKFAPAGMV